MSSAQRALFTAATLGLLLLAASPSFAGKGKREKHVDRWPQADLSGYSQLFIEDFQMADPKAHKRKKAGQTRTAGTRIADKLGELVEPGLFAQVSRGLQAPSAPETLIVRGRITQYKPGSPVGRFMLAGAGSAHLDFTVDLIAAESGTKLTSFSANRTWAWGGYVGAAKGVEDIETNIAEEIAMYLAQSTGTRRFTPSPVVMADAKPMGAPSQTEAQVGYIAELKALSDLRDQGILTDEEFEAKKQQLLGLEEPTAVANVDPPEDG